jgi:predicted metalloprotease
MKLDDVPESQNVEDRRGSRFGGRRNAAIGCGGLLVIIVISLLTGADPQRLLSILGGLQENTASVPETGGAPPAADDPQAAFVKKVLGTTEATWGRVFAASGRRYDEPTLVLFDGRVGSACGFASAAVGPFYCPRDQKVYLDLAFFRELDRRFEAPGDFAQAYVVAHEIGHHVQNLLGISGQVSSAQERARSEEEANAYSVRLELQADCFAGIWGRDQQALLDPGDVEEGLRAAAAIGDDMIQQQSQGYVTPETWTHGSAEMRVKWLRRGLESGKVEACDTFNSRL